MSAAEELLNSLAGTTTYSEDVNYVSIGNDRYMVVPESLKKLGVSPDHGVNTVHFVGPRYSENGTDLSEMSIWVNYMRADDYPDKARCENVTVDSNDSTLLHYDWVITRNVTEVHGDVTILVCAKSVDSAGNEKNHWNSEMCSDFYVSEGMEVDGDSIISQYPDLVEYMLLRIATVEDKTTKTAMLSYIDTYLDEDPSVIIEHIESIIADQPIQEFVNEYLDDCVDICTTEELILEGSNAGAYEMASMAGVSEQEQYEGYQLLDFSTIASSNITSVVVSEEGNVIKVTGSKAYANANIKVYIDHLVGETIYLSGSISGGTKPSYTVRLTKSDGTASYLTDILNGYTVVAGDSHIILQMIVNNTSTALSSYETVTFTGTMISTVQDAPWEPYCGGIPSPNFEYNQEIESVGTKLTITTMQGAEIAQGYWNTVGQLITGSGHITNATPIPCKPGDVVKIVIDDTDVTFSSRCFNSSGTNLTHTVTTSGNTRSFTVPSNAVSFCFILVKNGLTPETVGRIGYTINGVGKSSCTITISDNLRSDGGDIADKIVKKDGRWGVERWIVKKVFDGSSPSFFKNDGTESNSNYLYVANFAHTICLALSPQLVHTSALSPINGANLASNVGFCFNYSPSHVFLNVGYYLEENTVSAVTAYLAENPFEVWYAASEPTWEELDEDTQIALDNLEIYDTTTHVFVEGSDIPPVLTSKYGTSEVGARAISNTNAIEKTNDRIDAMEIQTTTENTLNNSKSGGLRLVDMEGNTEQKTLTGKNLLSVKSGSYLSIDSEGWITVSWDNSAGSSIAYKGVNADASELLEVSSEYLLVTEIASLSNASIMVSTSNVDSYTGQFKNDVTYSAVGTYLKVITTRASFDNCVTMLRTIIAVPAGVSGSCKFRLSVIKDTTVTEDTFAYEPYCGGIPSPNPDYPQVIENVGDYDEDSDKYVVPVKMTGKNLLKLTSARTDTNNGVTFTRVLNSEGFLEYIKVNGTATATIDYWFYSNSAGIGKSTIVSTGISEPTNGVYLIVQYKKGNSTYYKNTLNSEYCFDDATITGMYINVASGVTVNNVYFYPMIRESSIEDDTYEPYTSHTAHILLDEPLRKVGDISDRIIKQDGLWQVERNVGEVVFDGTETWLQSSVSDIFRTGNTVCSKLENVKRHDDYAKNIYIISNCFTATPYIDNVSMIDGTCSYFNGTEGKSFKFKHSTITTLEEWTAYLVELNTNGTPLKVQHHIDTTYEVLDTSSQLALNSLKTFDSVTYVEIDSKIQPTGCEWEYGTSQVGAYTLEHEHDIDDIEARLENLTAANIPFDPSVHSELSSTTVESAIAECIEDSKTYTYRKMVELINTTIPTSYYNKTEVDTMIGDINTILESIIG